MSDCNKGAWSLSGTKKEEADGEEGQWRLMDQSIRLWKHVVLRLLTPIMWEVVGGEQMFEIEMARVPRVGDDKVQCVAMGMAG